MRLSLKLQIAKKIWLATWSPETVAAPDASDVKRLREFMRRKYIVKEYVLSSCFGVRFNPNVSSSRFYPARRWYRTLDARARADTRVCVVILDVYDSSRRSSLWLT